MMCFRIIACCFTIAGVLAGCASPASPTVAPAVSPTTKQAEPATPAKPSSPAATPKTASADPKYGGILNVSTVGDPITLDMHQETAHKSQNVVQAGYSNVVQFDPNNPEQVIGDLAKTWEISADGLTYTFHLQPNVKFHDGTPFSAEDVRYSFDRQMNPPRVVAAPRRADLAIVDRIEAPDKETVKFILKNPSSSFLDVLSSGWMSIYSKAFVEKKGNMKNDVMGTGPYKFKGYASGTSVDYVKNTDYFVPGRPYLDGIVFYIIRDAATRLAAFRTGRVKLTGPGESGLTPSDAETVKKTMGEAFVMPYPAISRANWALNTQQAPWTDIRVRKAVDIALDRPKAINVLGEGYGDLGSFMPGKWGIPKDELLKMPGWRQPKDSDIAEAKSLLAQAGYPSGLTVKTLVVAQKRFEDLAVFIADQVAKIGVKLELDVKEAAIRTADLNRGTFNNHPMMSSLAYADPQSVARYWAPPLGDDWGGNWHRHNDPKIWELFQKQSSALDPAERAKIVREIDLKLIESSAQPVIFWRNDLIGTWPEVKNRGKVIGMFSFQKYQDIWLAK